MGTRNTLRGEQEGKMQEKETLDEKLPGLFEPDTLLPVQYFEAMRRKHLLEGEKRLILSVLEDAIECYTKCIESTTNKGQRLFRDAEEWINLEDKRWVFSFDNVCDMLDINSEYMRSGLKRWKERKLEEIARRSVDNAEPKAAEASSAVEEVRAAAPATERENGTAGPEKPIKLVPERIHPAAARNRKNGPVRAAQRRSSLRKAHA